MDILTLRNHVFYTCRDLKNILWKFKGFGISVSVLNFLEDEGIENILISYNNKYYFSSTATFFFNGYEHINGKDRQMVLELDKSVQVLNYMPRRSSNERY